MSKYITIVMVLFLFGCVKKSENIDLSFNLKPLPLDAEINTALDDADKLSTVNCNIAGNCPNIYLFIFETMRGGDFINPEDTPTFSHLKDESIHFEYGFSGATATSFSFYSLFYGRPGYERHPAVQNIDNGATSLRILKKLGYRIHFYAHPEWFFRLDPSNPFVKMNKVTDVLADEGQVKVLFGREQINDPLAYRLPNKAPNSSLGSSVSEQDTAIMNQAIAEVITPQGVGGHDVNLDSKNLFIFYAYGAHGPTYEWPASLSDVLAPNQINYPGYPADEQGWGYQNALIIKNSYRNALRGYDSYLNRVIDELKSIDKYDSSILIVTGDHGRSMYEEFGNNQHGRQPYKSQIEIPLYIKLKDNDSSHYLQRTSKMASHMDVFPTIFDYLGMENYLQDYYVGESVFKKNYKGHVVMKPNGRNPTNMIAFVNNEYKVMGRLIYPGDDVMQSTGFEVLDIRNLNDELIILSPNRDETYFKIKNDFSALFDKLFINLY